MLPIPPQSPLSTPRSSTSTVLSNSPLTPLFDLDKQVETLEITDTEAGPEESGSKDVDDILNKSSQSAVRKSQEDAQQQFSSFSFGSSASITDTQSSSHLTTPPRIPRPYPSPSSPQENFQFGTCPSNAVPGTPTVELGQFEYPEHVPSRTSSSSSSSHRESFSSQHRGSVGSLALGESHRRNSIINRPELIHSSESRGSGSSISTIGPNDLEPPTPPQTRRSSTLSTITTVPAAGRRPSIIHSSTLDGAVPILGSQFTTPIGSASTSRRGSLLFPLAASSNTPIPPSLLARRGSAPQNINLPNPLARAPPMDFHTISKPTYGQIGQVTTHQLYNRKDSVVADEPGELGRRASLRIVSAQVNLNSPTQTRRASMPVHSALLPTNTSFIPTTIHKSPQQTSPQTPTSPRLPDPASSPTRQRSRLSDHWRRPSTTRSISSSDQSVGEDGELETVMESKSVANSPSVGRD